MPGRTGFAFPAAADYVALDARTGKVTMQDKDRVLVRLHPSAPRRWLGTLMLAVLGGILLWVAMARPPEALGWRLFLLVLGGLALWTGVRLWQTTARGLELTASELRETDGGVVLARMEDIVSVDRGPFAFKPTAGFAVHLRSPGARAWAPGLWWRIGRRIGVGGVTHRHEGRLMAEILDDRLKQRDRAAD